jgi:hypothetical protein
MLRQPARHCGDFSPGHTPHFIQGLRSIEKEWIKANVEYLGSNIFRIELGDGQILTRFNHEPSRLLDHLSWFGQESTWFQSEFYLIGIETGSGRAMFNVSRKPIGACRAK